MKKWNEREIRSLPAGEELDALVEGVIMNGDPRAPRPFSRDVGAAFQVVDRMFERDEPAHHRFRNEMYRLGGELSRSSTMAPRICRAAILACLHPRGEEGGTLGDLVGAQVFSAL